jgi:hypothetical protein
MKKILTEAAVVGDATARAVSFYMPEKEAFYFDNSYWQLPFIGGYQFQTQPGVLNLNAYIYYYSWPPASRPPWRRRWWAKAPNMPGPPAIPVAWHSMIQTDQRFPSVSSFTKDLQINPDGSVDLYFGPKPPHGKGSN